MADQPDPELGSDDMVRKARDRVESGSTLSKPMPFRTGWLFLAATMLVTGACGGDPAADSTVALTPTTASTPTTAGDTAGAGWVTHLDDELGFSISHPEEWQRDASDETGNAVYSARSPSLNGALVQRVPLDLGSPAEDWAGVGDVLLAEIGEEFSESEIARAEVVQFDGYPAIRFDYYMMGEPNIVLTLRVPRGDVLWTVLCDPLESIGVQPTPEQLHTCESVLASFTLDLTDRSDPEASPTTPATLAGTEFEQATEANLANDVVEVCSFLKTEPDTWDQWYDNLAAVASRRLEALGSSMTQRGLAAFVSEVEARMQTVCPDQAAYLDRLVNEAELAVSEQDMAAMIVGAWELLELPDPWTALPNEAFEVDHVRESMADYCGQLDSGEAFDEAIAALLVDVADAAPKADSADQGAIARVIAALAVVLDCTQHEGAVLDWLSG